MAKLSAHGQEIGRIEFSYYTKAYMADGKILKNAGQGWKLSASVKKGFSPEDVFVNAKEKQRQHRESHPEYANYVRLLHNACGLSKRWKLHMAIQMMPEDPDGVWSEACDGYGDNVHLDIDEVSAICDAYNAAMREKNSMPA